VNKHGVAKEIWVAAKSGGFHFRREADLWVDTRDNSELFSKLSALATLQAGETVTLN
jgi:CyaY protein